MKNIILALALSLCDTEATSENWIPNTPQFFITDSTGVKIEAAMIEIEGKIYYTDFSGTVLIDLPPGVYTFKVSKLSCSQEEFEVIITEKTCIISLMMQCD